MLFNNPKTFNAVNGSDGTYFHEDVVLQRIVEKLTPHTVYIDNKEFIDAFSKTLINYSPVSINLMDYWNKRQLENILVPLKTETYDEVDADKILYNNIGEPQGIWLNSIKNLQERLSETYLNNMYTTAYKVRNSHTLRQKLYQLFDAFDIPMDDKNLLFNSINDLFKEERFITNKDYNTKKGKSICLKYAAQSAHDAGIEGPLKTTGFFLDYEEIAPLQYKVESVLLPDVFDAFVKPLAHPLGLGLEYFKVCKTEITDRVFNRLKWRATNVVISCTYASNTSPLLPPPVLLPWIKNPEWTSYVLAMTELDANYDPYHVYDDGETNLNPPMEEWVADLPYEAAIQNTELIDTNNPLPLNSETTFATDDGKGLWLELEIDENQGNILIDLQYGYGDEEYAGMSYTKYIFENGAYLIEYECLRENNTIERIIEYYRFDLFDTSIHYNTVADETVLPRWAYPNIKTVSLTHGIIDNIDLYPDGPLKTQKLFSLDDNPDPLILPPLDPTDSGGFDIGVFGPIPDNYYDEEPARLITTLPQDEGTVINTITSNDNINTLETMSLEGQTIFNTNLKVDELSVFVNGVKIRPSKYTTINRTIIFNEALQAGDWVSMVEKPEGHIVSDIITIQDQVVFPLASLSQNLSIFDNGVKMTDEDYRIDKIYTTEIVNGIEQKPVFTSIEVVFEQPADKNDWVQIIEMPNSTASAFTTAVEDQTIFYFGHEPVNVQVFIEGVKAKPNEYEVINRNIWDADGSYAWDEDRNVISTLPQFTEVYSLIGRWIKTRECQVIAYGLRSEESTGIEDDFIIRRVVYEENIIHGDENIITKTYNTDSTIVDDANVTNKYQ